MNTKKLILIIINSLIVLVVIVLSLSFYSQFSKVLDDRILLQLNSIKTLKKNQIENLIKFEWDKFIASDSLTESIDTTIFKLPKSIKNIEGIYDFTKYKNNKSTSIGFISNKKGTTRIEVLDYKKIEKILLERTGMGKSGESYLVGEDFHMRSQSRFFPDKIPYSITVKTKGVTNALKGISGKSFFEDYRGVNVYSAYSLIRISNLKMVILSEIDVSEVKQPLEELKYRLLVLTLIIALVAVLLSLILTRFITNPIKNMSHNLKIMAEGNYQRKTKTSKSSSEINQMFDALERLKESLRGAVKFSDDIGKMNLDAEYIPKSSKDLLGKSLLLMKDKLEEYRTNEEKNRILSKQNLLQSLENERGRLSRELHDGLGSYLTSLKHYIENKVNDQTKRLEMKQIVDDTIAEVRLMSYALMPASIYDFGVGTALTNFVDSLIKIVPIDIKYEDLTKSINSNITNNQAINLYRICQELITNSVKHSKASHIRITLSEFDDFISLFYYDDGVGFDFDNVQLGSGILNIKERVEICNGKIAVNSKKGNTTFEIEMPTENE